MLVFICCAYLSAVLAVKFGLAVCRNENKPEVMLESAIWGLSIFALVYLFDQIP